VAGLPGEPLRPVTSDEVAAFADDGVVYLPGILPAAWLDHLADPVDDTIADRGVTTDMSALGADLGVEVLSAGTGAGGRFLSGVDHWHRHPAFAAFAMGSPLAGIAGALMDAAHVHLYEDSVLVKEPGTDEETAFHQDLGYFHLEGDRICTTWVPLDPVDASTGGMVYLRGSHRSGTVYRPNYFVTADPIPGTEGAPVPVLRPGDDHPDLVQFAAEPGDVVVHHAATLHGAHANRSATARRRAVSVRYCGDGVRYRLRPGAPTKDHHAQVTDGDEVVHHPGCPLVWRRDDPRPRL
jgi:ectoine hydroxylase-related dioxygenase (phytanoyl-CoA dioxygenase family)